MRLHALNTCRKQNTHHHQDEHGNHHPRRLSSDFGLDDQATDTELRAYVIEHGSKQVGSVKMGTRAAARRAKLPGVTPHVLRHTAATWVAMAGVLIEQIAHVLGHTDPRLTLRVYAKHSPDHLCDAVDAITGNGATVPIMPVGNTS